MKTNVACIVDWEPGNSPRRYRDESFYHIGIQSKIFRYGIMISWLTYDFNFHQQCSVKYQTSLRNIFVAKLWTISRESWLLQHAVRCSRNNWSCYNGIYCGYQASGIIFSLNINGASLATNFRRQPRDVSINVGTKQFHIPVAWEALPGD